MKPFNQLTKDNVEYLRRMPAGVPIGRSGFSYNFSPADIDAAINHLKTLYEGEIRQTFAEKILIRNEIYYAERCRRKDEPVCAAIEPGSCVRALLERFPESNRDEVKDFVNTSFTNMKRDAERREQLIYGRGFDPANYSSDGIAYFQGISMDMLRQLIAEGFLNPFERQNDSPTVKEMMDFCAGEDEDNWIFHGYTVSPERIDYRVSIEGFEARTEPLPFRKKEFAQFNHKASELLLEEGECYCWYD